MTSRLLTEGLLHRYVSDIATAEAIIMFMIGGCIHIAYTAIANGKLSKNNEKLRGFYINFIWTEWADLIQHILVLVYCADIDPTMVFIGFEIGHIATSIAQVGIRHKMTVMMVNTLHWEPIMTWIFLITPFIIRIVCVVILFIVYYSVRIIPGLNVVTLIGCEALSFIYDLIIINYAYLVLVEKRPQLTFVGLLLYHFELDQLLPISIFMVGYIMMIVGQVAPVSFGIRYLSPIGISIASAIFYAHRGTLVDRIDLYIATFQSSHDTSAKSKNVKTSNAMAETNKSNPELGRPSNAASTTGVKSSVVRKI